MKKFYRIVFLLLFIIINLSFVIYGQIKANEARKNADAAKRAQQEAIQVADIARQQAIDAAARAKMAEAESQRQNEIADMATLKLQECMNK